MKNTSAIPSFRNILPMTFTLLTMANLSLDKKLLHSRKEEDLKQSQTITTLIQAD